MQARTSMSPMLSLPLSPSPQSLPHYALLAGSPIAGRVSLAAYPDRDYIMPPMPGLGIAGAGFSSFLSTMPHSVVRNMPAMEAAF